MPNESKKKKLPVKERKCPKCKVEKFEPKHSCPYLADMDGDSSKVCNCCVSCQNVCAADV